MTSYLKLAVLFVGVFALALAGCQGTEQKPQSTDQKTTGPASADNAKPAEKPPAPSTIKYEIYDPKDKNKVLATFEIKTTPISLRGQHISGGPVLISSDSRRCATVLKDENGKQYVSLDGKKCGAGAPSDPANWAFSPDSKRFAYAAKVGDAWVIVMDGASSPAKGIVKRIFFSEDSTRFGYIARSGEEAKVEPGQAGVMKVGPPIQEWLVIDGKETAKYDAVWPPSFSPDGKHTAFIARSQDKMYVVMDGVDGNPYESILTDLGVRFSPDGKNVMFVAGPKAEERLVISGTVHPEFNGMPVFSQDGKRAAYIGRFGEKTKILVDAYPKKPDGGKTFDYRRASDVVFSPDSQHYAFVARRNDHTTTYVLDGKEGGTFEGTRPAVVEFSPDSKRLTFVLTQDNGNEIVVVDGAKGKEHKPVHYSRDVFSISFVEHPFFSPDSKRVAYAAETDDGKGLVVLDDYDIPVGAKIVSAIVFDSPTSLHAIGIAGDSIVSIEIEIK
jgi:WD40 repeat protein